MNKSVISLFGSLGLQLTEQQQEQFKTYYQELIEWNTKLNLTSITDEHEVYIKHFYDSLCLIKAVDIDHKTLLDVGSGAGFPSIPLKIMFPTINITIIDALAKRIKFLEHLTNKLDLSITLIHGRAEEFKARESYDIVTARAVANMQILSELCIPFVRMNGFFVAMKGPNYEEELEQSKHAFTILGGTLDKVIEYDMEGFKRNLIVVQKQHQTPSKYPRRYNKIKSKPL